MKVNPVAYLDGLPLRAKYYLWFLKCWSLRLPLIVIEKFWYRSSTIGVYEGIRIVQLSSDGSTSGRFLNTTLHALREIQRLDIRRFRRIQKEIKCIVNIEQIALGSYRRPLRACRVDFQSYDFEKHPDWCFRCYCCLLVHEATHGFINSCFIPYTRKTRERIERACHVEEQRFAARLWPVGWQQIVGEFQVEQWHFGWYGSWWATSKRLWKRLKEKRS